LKEKIQALLDGTKGLKEQFLFIQALGNIERARASLNPQSQLLGSMAELRTQAVDIFLDAASSQGFGYSSLLGNYNGSANSLQFLLGANYTI
jgi:hypothetical protein